MIPQDTLLRGFQPALQDVPFFWITLVKLEQTCNHAALVQSTPISPAATVSINITSIFQAVLSLQDVKRCF